MGRDGWTFADGPGVVSDPIFSARFLREIYLGSDPKHTGRVTVPVLFDKRSMRIVNNESADILRMFNSAFDGVGASGPDFYPSELRDEIDGINALVYPKVNNGVYRSGFAGSQSAYDDAVTTLFSALDDLEKRLTGREFLVGDRATEADWRLFTTLIRFDAVYVGHFKCNLRRIADYPALTAYLKRLFHTPGVAETVDFLHIKSHYYQSHPKLNPSGIVPKGPLLEW